MRCCPGVVQILTSTLATPWMLKEEAKGNVIEAWPESVIQLLGEGKYSFYGHLIIWGFYLTEVERKSS